MTEHSPRRRKITTVADLEAMTPAERHQDFLDSVVLDPAELTDRQRAMVDAQMAQVIERYGRGDGQGVDPASPVD